MVLLPCWLHCPGLRTLSLHTSEFKKVKPCRPGSLAAGARGTLSGLLLPLVSRDDVLMGAVLPVQARTWARSPPSWSPRRRAPGAATRSPSPHRARATPTASSASAPAAPSCCCCCMGICLGAPAMPSCASTQHAVPCTVPEGGGDRSMSSATSFLSFLARCLLGSI